MRDEQERAELEVKPGAGGRVEGVLAPRQPDGSQSFDYVIDPVTLKVLRVPLEAIRPGNQAAGIPKRFVHHSTPLAGGDVAGAGNITVGEGGHIERVNDQSGHYKPGSRLAHQTVRILDGKGMLLDAQLRDVDGRQLVQALGQLGETGQKLGDKYFALKAEIENPATPEDRRQHLIGQQKLLVDKLAEHGIVAGNVQAMVNILGKSAMVDEAEYAAIKAAPDPRQAAVTAVRRKILGVAVGEAAYADLTKRVTLATKAEIARLKAAGQPPGAEAIAKIRTACYREAVAPYGAEGVADLKSKLGAEALAGKDDDELAALSLEYGITPVETKDITEVTLRNQALLNFFIGQRTSVELRKGQFLSTGGNEEQIRLKAKITDDALAEQRRQLASAPGPISQAEREMLGEKIRSNARRKLLAELDEVRTERAIEEANELEMDKPEEAQRRFEELGAEDRRDFRKKLGLDLVPPPEGPHDEHLIAACEHAQIESSMIAALKVRDLEAFQARAGARALAGSLAEDPVETERLRAALGAKEEETLEACLTRQLDAYLRAPDEATADRLAAAGLGQLLAVYGQLNSAVLRTLIGAETPPIEAPKPRVRKPRPADRKQVWGAADDDDDDDDDEDDESDDEDDLDSDDEDDDEDEDDEDEAEGLLEVEAIAYFGEEKGREPASPYAGGLVGDDDAGPSRPGWQYGATPEQVIAKDRGRDKGKDKEKEKETE